MLRSKKTSPPFFLCIKEDRKGRQKQKEPGNVADLMGCVLVMMFVFAMLFAYIGYARMVEMRLAIDNVAKEYLYQMEQVGYLSGEMKTKMTKDLGLLGVDESSVKYTGTTHSESNQAPYGEKMTLCCEVTFANPLYEMLSSQTHGNALFSVANLKPTITYHIRMTATAKW